MQDTLKLRDSRVKMIAHRGVSGLERENTAAAFVAAGNRSYWGIETDVHRTQDGAYVIIHDDDTRRVADENLPVEGSTLHQLRTLTLKDMDGLPRQDLVLPLLPEYSRICRKYGKVSVLELKNHFAPEQVAEILRGHKYEVELTDVLRVKVPSRAGALANMLVDIAKEKINLEYMYAFATGDGDEMIIRPSDVERTNELLSEYN